MSESFRTPDSFDAKPWCFWYWMYGAVSKEGITADLEAMASNGLGGAYLMPIQGVKDKPEIHGTLHQLSPEWYQMVDWAMQECDRLDLKLGMHISDGFALAGGPWISKEESMQKLVMTDIDNLDGTTVGYFSIPSKYLKGEKFFTDTVSTDPKLTSIAFEVKGEGEDLKIDTIGGGFRAKKPCTVTYTFDEPITVSALELVLPVRQFQAQRLDVYASLDGYNFNHVKRLVPPRAGRQDFEYNTTHSIPTTTARIWQFKWDPEGTEPGSEDLDNAKWQAILNLKHIIFHAAPHIHQWEGKAGLVWRVSSMADNTLESFDYIPLKDVHQISSRHHINTNDVTSFYFRLASVSTGQKNASGGDAKGLECDKFNREAVRKQLDGWFNSHFTAPVPGSDSYEHQELAKRVLKYMHVDSWECGSQNWSEEFAQEFRKRRGYSLTPYLPLMVGFPLESEETSERVLRDVRLTINDLIDDVFFDELRRNALLMDCHLSAEAVCPTMVSDGISHYRYADLPMGEFWLNSPTHDRMNDILDAVSGGHIYGKRIIQAEGFAEESGAFNEDPAMLKPLLDRNFCLGINRLFYHVWCHNPNPKLRPGMTPDGIGLLFQQSNTWFDQSSAFTLYITRCQYLLQQGRPVVDLAVFTGQEMPRRAFLPDRLVPMLPGIVGKNRVLAETDRLANHANPIVEKPVKVQHNANILVPENWINCLHGYNYDSYNEDALMRCRVYGGHISMESLDQASPAYGALILPLPHPLDPDTVAYSPEVLNRLDELRRMGATIVTSDQLPWNDASFSRLHLPRDVDNLPDGVAFCHRSTDDAEIYFLSNQLNIPVTLRPSFRDSKARQPELWDPMDGSIRTMNKEICLAPYGSVFVIFPVSPTDEQDLDTPFVDEGRAQSILTLSNTSWDIDYLANGKHLTVDSLPDWSQHPNDSIRYYSGQALYRGTFVVDSLASSLSALADGGRLYLRLNDVANIATVSVNGVDCGVAWTAPFEVDVTDALRLGVNNLSLLVSNTWNNALQGHDKGHDPFPGIWTNASYRKAENELHSAGIFGPIELIRK